MYVWEWSVSASRLPFKWPGLPYSHSLSLSYLRPDEVGVLLVVVQQRLGEGGQAEEVRLLLDPRHVSSGRGLLQKLEEC